jgi:hypothetical protein
LLQGSQTADSYTDTGILSIPTTPKPHPYTTIFRTSYITASKNRHNHSLLADLHREIRCYDFPKSWKILNSRLGPESTKLEYSVALLCKPQIHLTIPINSKILTAGLLFYLEDKCDGNPQVWVQT